MTRTSAASSSQLPNVGTPGTYTKVTTDAKGRVTVGGAVLESDITDGTLLARLAANETVAGAWSFTSTITVVSAAFSATGFAINDGGNYYATFGYGAAWRFSKPDTSSFLFYNIGGPDSISPFWSGCHFGGHAVTVGGVPQYPVVTFYTRSVTLTDPVDYEAVIGIGNLTTAIANLTFAASEFAGSTVRFGFGAVNLGSFFAAMTLHQDKTVSLAGGLRVSRVTKTADYTATVADYLIAYAALAASRTVTLPTAASAGAGRVYIIKDESGAAATGNSIIVKGNGTEPIDGSTPAAGGKEITTAYGALSLYADAAAGKWFSF